jgi:transcription initiation factor IIE alpha subunit
MKVNVLHSSPSFYLILPNNDKVKIKMDGMYFKLSYRNGYINRYLLFLIKHNIVGFSKTRDTKNGFVNTRYYFNPEKDCVNLIS